MVHHQHDGQSYWTLPGGGIEPNESLEEAAIREVYEETNLKASVERRLFVDGRTTCFLLQSEDTAPRLGYDPELESDNQMLVALAWFPLEEVADDVQVSKVLKALE
jgi:8-oxo-dGTP diphosphatase